MNKVNDSKVKKLIIFGGNGKFGKLIISKLKSHFSEIINFSDKHIHNDMCKTIVYKDLEDLERHILDLLVEGFDTIIFSHRARNQERGTLGTINRELTPYYATEAAINRLNSYGRAINIISLNSSASEKLNIDINFNYHVTKAATLQAAMTLGVEKKENRVTSNIILFGEVVDENNTDHTEAKKAIYSNIAKYTSNKMVATYQLVVNAVKLLATSELSGVNRQILRISEGIEELSVESIIRAGSFE